MKTLEFYDNYIQTHFTSKDCGINFGTIGKVAEEVYFPIESMEQLQYEFYAVRERLKLIVQFLETQYIDSYERPLWYRINVLDQAINQYLGIGRLNLESDWIKFILDYLCNDLADQGGDTLFTIFDTDFKWAICFTLSQETKRLIVEKYEK